MVGAHAVTQQQEGQKGKEGRVKYGKGGKYGDDHT